jgi:hypothetical protein
MNNKYSGTKADFSPVREDASRIIISYGLTKLSKDLYEWFEVHLYKKQRNALTLADVKEAILGDINAHTDEKILSGFVWTPEGGNAINVWLSNENQRNFSEAQRMAEKYGDMVLPVRFKLGEDAEGNPVYHVFETVAELDSFYAEAFAFVNQCLNEGWARKDSINWSEYEVFFPVTNV